MPLDDDKIPLFAERPEWADVTPLEQYENLTPLAPILYTEECEPFVFLRSKVLFIDRDVFCRFFLADKDATNYFRAIVKKGEKSLRVLDLTEQVIELNPAHYSAWYVFLLAFV